MPVPWLDVGVAYHQVRDGVQLAADDQPKEGDKAAVFGLRLSRGRLLLAATDTMFEEHERDDLGVWFGGRGLELSGRFELVERWHAYAGWNSLDPNSDYEGRYQLRYASGGVMRTFGPDGASAAFVELRDDRTRLAGGGDREGGGGGPAAHLLMSDAVRSRPSAPSAR